MEEALSSYEAERDLRDAGRSAAQGRAVLDQQAAVRILQSFLDQPEAKRKTIMNESPEENQKPHHADPGAPAPRRNRHTFRRIGYTESTGSSGSTTFRCVIPRSRELAAD